jgi:hypothetical protein
MRTPKKKVCNFVGGVAAHTLWNNAHTATLEDYGLPATPSALYHPEAERYIPK